MRVLFPTCVCILLALSAQASFFDDDTPQAPVSGAGVTFEPVFSSADTLAETPSDAAVKAIASAKKSIRVAARDFTSKPVSEAIVDAARAGIDVKIVLDKKANAGIESVARFLMTMEMTPHATKGDNTIYANYIVIDERDVILGNAMTLVDRVEEKKNAAQALVIYNAPDLARKYLAHWQTLWAASEVMKKSKD